MNQIQDFQWMNQNYAMLQKKYPNMYVAIKDENVIAANREFGRMYDEAMKKCKDFVTGYILSGEPFVLKINI